MPGNGKVFVSHAYEDNQRCVPLVAALDAWGIDYWFDAGMPEGATSAQLSPAAQKAIAERDVFLRVCTAASQQSLGVNMEAGAFRVTLAQHHGRRGASNRSFINLILDPAYVREPFDNATLFIDGTNRPRPVWLADLGRALGMNPAARALNRRTFLALGAAVAVTVASAATTGVVLVSQSAPASTKKVDLSKTTSHTRWEKDGLAQFGTPNTATDGSRVYVVSDDRTGSFAFDAATGRQIWRQPAVFALSGQPSLGGGMLFIGVDSDLSQGGVVALDAATGRQIWHVSVGTVNTGMPVYANGIVYHACDDGTLYALRASDGSKAWRAPLPNVLTTDSPEASPAVGNGVVVAGSFDHNIYAFDAKSGKQLWKYLTRGPVVAQPTIANGVVCVGSRDGTLYALDLTDGKLRWKFQTGSDILGACLVRDGFVYIGSTDDYLYALRASDGAFFWRALSNDKGSTASTFSGIATRPAISDLSQAVYITAGGLLYSFNITDGTLRWRFKANDNSNITSPMVVNDLVLFGSSDKTLYAINV